MKKKTEKQTEQKLNWDMNICYYWIVQEVQKYIQCAPLHRSSNFGTNRKHVCDFVLVNYTKLHHILHYFQIIGQVFAFDEGTSENRGTPNHSKPLLAGTTKLKNMKFGDKKLETSLYHMVWNVFWYLEPRGRGEQVWQTDRQTEWPLAVEYWHALMSSNREVCISHHFWKCVFLDLIWDSRAGLQANRLQLVRTIGLLRFLARCCRRRPNRVFFSFMFVLARVIFCVCFFLCFGFKCYFVSFVFIDCNWLTEKTCIQNDPWSVKTNVKCY